MENMTYITIELKTNDEGGTAADVLYSGIDRRMAEKKYHEALSIATTSGRLCHAAVIIQGDGTFVQSYGYVKETSTDTEE